MANSAQILTKLDTLLGRNFSNRLKSNLGTIMPTTQWLLMKNGGRRGYEGSGIIDGDWVYSGTNITPAQRKYITSTGTYYPVFESAMIADDGKVMGQRDTMPTKSNPTTNVSVDMLTRPFFRFTEIAHPALVWNKDVDRCLDGATSDAAAVASLGGLFGHELKQTEYRHLARWNTMMFATSSDAPSNVDATSGWDKQYSFKRACAEDGIYAGVDRDLSANAAYRGNLITAARPVDPFRLLDFINFERGLYSKGGREIDLLVVGTTLFPVMREIAKTRGARLARVGDVFPYAKAGHEREIVKVNNTWILCDPSMPIKRASVNGSKNAVLGLTTDTWTVIFNPAKRFTKTAWKSLMESGEGQKDATQCFLRTELMVACEMPSANIYLEDVGPEIQVNDA